MNSISYTTLEQKKLILVFMIFDAMKEEIKVENDTFNYGQIRCVTKLPKYTVKPFFF